MPDQQADLDRRSRAVLDEIDDILRTRRANWRHHIASRGYAALEAAALAINELQQDNARWRESYILDVSAAQFHARKVE